MNRLKELRLMHGWSMKKASQEIGMPYTTYVGYEKEERELHSEQLVMFADFYGCSVDYLVGKENTSTDADEMLKERQLMRDDPTRRILLHATDGMTTDEIQAVTAMIMRMKGKNADDY